MIPKQLVEVRWTNRVKAHYEALRYEFTGKNDVFFVPPEHLPAGSSKRITVVCDSCGKQRTLEYNRYNPTCKLCTLEATKSRPEVMAKIKAKASVTFTRLHQDPAFQERRIAASKDPNRRAKVRESKLGPKNPAWIQGRTPEEREFLRVRFRDYPEYRLWRTQVFTRDEFQCQSCGAKRRLEAHHLASYSAHPETRLEVDNGITLCTDCHAGFHRTYGNQHNTPEQFRDWRNINDQPPGHA